MKTIFNRKEVIKLSYFKKLSRFLINLVLILLKKNLYL